MKSALAALLVGLGCMATGQTRPAPLRHIEYHFDLGYTADLSQHVSGISNARPTRTSVLAGSGIQHSRKNGRDEGTIRVDVLGVRDDGGMVLSVNETADVGGSVAPTSCIVYGNTHFVCERDKAINVEAMELVRLLGRNFSQVIPLDAKNHWQYHETWPDSEESDDFTVEQNNLGVLSIALQRTFVIRAGTGLQSSTTSRITYDRGLALPTIVSEQTITRMQQGTDADNRSEAELDLKLISDSRSPH